MPINNKATAQTESDLTSRVGRLEGQMTEMASAVTRLAATYEKAELIQEQRDAALHAKLDNIVSSNNAAQVATIKEFAEKGKTNWSVLFGAGSLILAISVYLIDLNISPLKLSQEKAIEQESRLIHREMELVDRLNQERFSNTEQRIDTLEGLKLRVP